MKKFLVASTAVTAAAVLASGIGANDAHAKSSTPAEHAKKVKKAEKYLNEKGEYTVVKGDTLNKIADKFDVEVKDLKKWNKKESDLILVDESLKVKEPTKEQAAQTTQTAAQASSNESYNYTTEQTSYSNYNAEPTSYAQPTKSYSAPAQSYSAPTYSQPSYQASTSSVRLSNGNTPGATGSYAASQMAARTGVSASVWEQIIARESNGQVNAYNPSGASGLFQTMPGWGSTNGVDNQINAAVRAYNAQGLSAWGF